MCFVVNTIFIYEAHLKTTASDQSAVQTRIKLKINKHIKIETRLDLTHNNCPKDQEVLKAAL